MIWFCCVIRQCFYGACIYVCMCEWMRTAVLNYLSAYLWDAASCDRKLARTWEMEGLWKRSPGERLSLFSQPSPLHHLLRICFPPDCSRADGSEMAKLGMSWWDHIWCHGCFAYLFIYFLVTALLFCFASVHNRYKEQASHLLWHLWRKQT